MKASLRDSALLLLKFVKSARTLALTAVLALGILLAVQSKLPVNPQGYPESPGSELATKEYRFRYTLPVASYDGPVIVRITHGVLPHQCSLAVKSSNKTLAYGYIPGETEGVKSFLLYPGSLANANSFSVVLMADESFEAKEIINDTRLEFPKAGRWLIPDIALWVGLVLIGFLLSATADLFWNSLPVGHACFAVTSLLMVLAVFFFGLEFAARLGNLLPEVILLLLLVVLGRSFLLSRRPAENNHASLRAD